MNICITGALGHIGSYLIRHIDAPGIERIHLVDNMSKQRYATLFDLPDGRDYIFHEMDILSPDLEEIVKDSDVVIHLAAISDAESSFKEQAQVQRVNIEGLEYVAGLCAKHSKSLFFPSTTSVYSSAEGTLSEDAVGDELTPQNPYAESKLKGENMLRSMAKEKGLSFVILRFGTIFGFSVGMRFNTAVNKFIFQALSGQKISVWKTAYDQKRPYCDLIDCAAAINYVLAKKLFDGDVYNIVTDNYTVKEIVEKIKKYVPGLEPEFVDSAIMNTHSYGVSNAKSAAKGFTYSGDLDKSLKELVHVMKNMNSSVIKKNI